MSRYVAPMADDADYAAMAPLLRPSQQHAPLIFSLPHSGRYYPDAFIAASRLDAHELRRSEDAFVDKLLAEATTLGPMLIARQGRSFVDLNRAIDELDPRMIRDDLAGITPNITPNITHRVRAGLGVVPAIVAEHFSIYDFRIAASEINTRLTRLYRPYHDQLHDLLAQTLFDCGYAILLDCHSMPSDSHTASALPDIILGDVWGQSAATWVTNDLEKSFIDAGFSVARNAPYAGGYAARHYGRPHQSCHTVQIEINRGLYLDESAITPNDQFGSVSARIMAALGQFAHRLPHSQSQAAE